MNTINKAIAGIAIVASLATTASAQVVGSTETGIENADAEMTTAGFVLGSAAAEFGSNILFAFADAEYLELASLNLDTMNVAASGLSEAYLDDDAAYEEFAQVIEATAEDIADGDYEYGVVLESLYGAFDEFMMNLLASDEGRVTWYGYLGFWHGYAGLSLVLYELEIFEAPDVQDSLQVFVGLAQTAADNEDAEVKRIVTDLAKLAEAEKFGKKQLEATYELIEELWTIIVGEC
ncbi:MAG: hypothetical protein AKCLJLPJ_00979 [Fimbriimonadales bacterium]|nr:hypothetical protein [Fimbriimonadales bacterium]